MHEEPPTNGKVVIVTTMGDLEIELWSRETPKTCRNFIQLCLEGYYQDVPFHRLIPKFLIQGGDPTGTGAGRMELTSGGQSVWGEPFQDEISTRLKFAYRGLVGMAGAQSNDNRSQFFITFDRVDSLYKKHTLFGKVVGDTIYNLMAMEKLETDALDRPYNPPKILQTKVIQNPFSDIFPRELMLVRPDLAKKLQEDAAKKNAGSEKTSGMFKKPLQKQEPKRKTVSLMEDEDEELAIGKLKPKAVKPKEPQSSVEAQSKPNKQAGLHQLLMNDMGLAEMSQKDFEILKRKEAELLESQKLKDSLKSGINNEGTGDSNLGKRTDMAILDRIAMDARAMKESGDVTLNPKTGRAEIRIADEIGENSKKSRSTK